MRACRAGEGACAQAPRRSGRRGDGRRGPAGRESKYEQKGHGQKGADFHRFPPSRGRGAASQKYGIPLTCGFVVRVSGRNPRGQKRWEIPNVFVHDLCAHKSAGVPRLPVRCRIARLLQGLVRSLKAARPPPRAPMTESPGEGRARKRKATISGGRAARRAAPAGRSVGPVPPTRGQTRETSINRRTRERAADVARPRIAERPRPGISAICGGL